MVKREEKLEGSHLDTHMMKNTIWIKWVMRFARYGNLRQQKRTEI